jgi:endonuclease/exonuclease/phosphatase family metal-dependent hydrolase
MFPLCLRQKKNRVRSACDPVVPALHAVHGTPSGTLRIALGALLVSSLVSATESQGQRVSATTPIDARLEAISLNGPLRLTLTPRSAAAAASLGEVERLMLSGTALSPREVREAFLYGGSEVHCTDGAGHWQRWAQPIDVRRTGARRQRVVRVNYLVDVTTLRAMCVHPFEFHSLTGAAKVVARAPDGSTATTASIDFYHGSVSIKVATLNMQFGCKDHDLHRIAAVLSRADIALVTEVDSNTVRGNPDCGGLPWPTGVQARVISRESGLANYYYGVMGHHNRGTTGSAIFSRMRFDARSQSIEVAQGTPAVTKIHIAVLTVFAAQYNVMLTHWPYAQSDTQLRRVVGIATAQRIRETGGPIFFGGDLNSLPGEAGIDSLARVLTNSYDAATAGGVNAAPDRSIDQVFFRGPYKVTGYEHILAPTDHGAMVLVEFRKIWQAPDTTHPVTITVEQHARDDRESTITVRARDAVTGAELQGGVEIDGRYLGLTGTRITYRPITELMKVKRCAGDPRNVDPVFNPIMRPLPKEDTIIVDRSRGIVVFPAGAPYANPDFAPSPKLTLQITCEEPDFGALTRFAKIEISDAALLRTPLGSVLINNIFIGRTGERVNTGCSLDVRAPACIGVVRAEGYPDEPFSVGIP